jgi:hypothetical protein
MALTDAGTPGALDTTALAYQFKRVYGDMITDLFANHTMTYNQFIKSDRKASVRPGGAGYYFATRQSDIESVGGRGEGQYLPEPLKGDGVQGNITPKLIYAVLRLSGLAIEAGKGDVAAFVNAQSDATMSAYRALTVDLNRQCWGDGYGKLATLSKVSDTPTSNASWTVTCSNDVGVRYLRKGMVVDFYTSSGAVDTSACSQRIEEVHPNNKTVEMEPFGNTYRSYHPNATIRAYSAGNGTVASGSQIVRQGARDTSFATSDTSYEITGMDGLFDDGTLIATFEGITIANDPEFKANILSNSSVNRELSIDLMLAAMDIVPARSAGQVDTIWMGMGQRRKYFGLLAPDVRYTPGDFLGGYERLAFAQNSQVKIIMDPMCQPNALYMAPINAIKRYELTPIGWGGFDPNKMHWRQDYDEATMFLRTYTQLGVENRRQLVLLKDLVEPSVAGESPF